MWVDPITVYLDLFKYESIVTNERLRKICTYRAQNKRASERERRRWPIVTNPRTGWRCNRNKTLNAKQMAKKFRKKAFVSKFLAP